jgi:sirohydrochlorin cobaltochelatase
MAQAVILFAHGSRDPLWRAPIEAVAQRVRLLAPTTLVRCAYLELCEPDLPTATQALVHEGVTHLRVLPIFFGMGRHTREDLPELIQALRKQHPALQIDVRPTAGESTELLDLLAWQALGTPNACQP